MNQEPPDAGTAPVLQLRVVVEVEDFDGAAAFFRDALGLAEEFSIDTGDARVIALQAGRATLELVNREQREYIDSVEVGRPVAPRFRLAFEVADSTTTTATLAAAGAELIAEPTRTPWRSLNARLSAPGDVQMTVFQELD